MNVYLRFEWHRCNRTEDQIQEEIAEFREMAYADYLRTPYWAMLRDCAIQAVGRRCRRCRKSGAPLNVHHRSYDHIGEEYRYPQDLVVLCQNCHEKNHREERILCRVLDRDQLRLWQRKQVRAI